MDDSRHSGITLIELLISITLVALLAGLAIPAIGQLIDRHRLRGAGEALVQELRYARQHAVINQVTTHFTLASASASDWCYGWRPVRACDCRPESSDRNSCTIDAAQQHVRRWTASDYPTIVLSLNTADSNRALRFSAIRGTATAATLTLRNAAGELRIIISPLGRVRSCSTGVTGFRSC